jgi:hypothetical protein
VRSQIVVTNEKEKFKMTILLTAFAAFIVGVFATVVFTVYLGSTLDESRAAPHGQKPTLSKRPTSL